MKNKISLFIMLFAITLLCVSCSPDNSPTSQAGVATGKVTTANGKPLSGAQVLISGTTSAGQDGSVQVQTDTNGIYSAKLPDGNYSFKAWLPLQYNGRNYTVWLQPEGGQWGLSYDSSKGIVQNFVFKLTGKNTSPNRSSDPNDPRSFIGTDIRVDFNGGQGANDMVQTNDGDTIEVTLTPNGPLMDGSTIQPLTYRYDKKTDGLSDWWITDIPYGDYTATAQVISGGNAQPLRLGQEMNPSNADLKEQLPIVFQPYLLSSIGSERGVGEIYIDLSR